MLTQKLKLISFKEKKVQSQKQVLSDKKSRIRDTGNLSTDADSNTNIFVSAGVKKGLIEFFVLFFAKKKKNPPPPSQPSSLSSPPPPSPPLKGFLAFFFLFFFYHLKH